MQHIAEPLGDRRSRYSDEEESSLRSPPFPPSSSLRRRGRQPNEKHGLFRRQLPAHPIRIGRRERDPVRIQIGRGDTQPGTALVRQSAYMVQRSHKPAALGRILDIEGPKATLVFCRTRIEVAVAVPDNRSGRFELQRTIIEASIRRLARLAEAA